MQLTIKEKTMNNLTPLRYRISSLAQLPQCLSNNSAELRLSYAQYSLDNEVVGHQVIVRHARAGIMFAAFTDGTGYCISERYPDGNIIPWMTIDEILVQLAKFGFLIEYSQEGTLPGDQVKLLLQLLNLGYDNLTRVVVCVDNMKKSHLIAVDADVSPNFLSWGREVPYEIFAQALIDGGVQDLTRYETEYNWNWLHATSNIEKLLEENAEIIEPVIPQPDESEYTEYTDPEYHPEPDPIIVPNDGEETQPEQPDVEPIEGDTEGNTEEEGQHD